MKSYAYLHCINALSNHNYNNSMEHFTCRKIIADYFKLVHDLSKNLSNLSNVTRELSRS